MPNVELLHQRISSSHLPALDGLRFVAVLLVIFYHSGFESVPGGHGVMLFFVLSGFLITWLLLKENEKTQTISLKGFFRRRVLRIFPAFYAYALVTIGLLIATKKDVPWTHAISSFFYFSNYFAAFNPESNNAFSHTWSLAVEEQFYLFFPFLFLLFCRNLKHLTAAVCAIIGAAWLWRVILVFGFNASGGYIYSAFETRLDHLLIGCLLAIILRRKSLEKVWRIVLVNSLMPFTTLACLAISIAFSQSNVTYKSTLGFTIEPILMAIFIVQAMTFSGRGIWKWLEYESVKFLGALSYSLYLYQQLTTSIIPNKLAGFPVVLQMTATITITISVAVISYYLIETPFLELKTMSVREVINYNWLKIRVIFARDQISRESLKGFLAQQQTETNSAAQESINIIEKRSN